MIIKKTIKLNLNSGLNLETFIQNKQVQHSQFHPYNHLNQALNIIYFGKSIPLDFIGISEQVIKPLKITFLKKTIIPNLTENLKNINDQSKILSGKIRPVLKQIGTKPVIFDLSDIYKPFILSFNSYAKNTVKENFEQLINSIIKDFKVKNSTRNTILLLTESNVLLNKPTQIESILDFFKYMSSFNLTFNSELDAIIFLDENTGNFYPLTLPKKEKENLLSINKTILIELLKTIDKNFDPEQLLNPFKTIIDPELLNKKEDIKKELLNTLNNLEKMDTKENENNLNYVQKEILINKIKELTLPFPGNNIDEKLTYIFGSKKEINSELDGDKNNKNILKTKEKEVSDISVISNKVKSNIEEFEPIYNGSILMEDIKENFIKQVYNPMEIVNIDSVSSINKQKTELFEKLDKNIQDLSQVFLQDKELNLQIVGITNKLIENNRSRFIEYNIKIKHNYKNTSTKPYSLTFRIPAPVDDKYLRISGNNYIMIQQLFPQPIQKISNTLCRLYTHYNVTSINLKGSKLENKDFLEIEKSFIEQLINGKFLNKKDIKEIDKKAVNILLEEYKLPLSFSSLLYNFKIKINEQKNISFNFDAKFSEIIRDGNKVFQFYEKYENNRLIEYAYITKFHDNIVYINNNDIRSYPKNKINEFVNNLYNNISNELLKTDLLKKNKSSLTFFNLRISKINIPLINYFILIKGWKETLDFFNINYNISNKKENTINNENFSLKFKNTYINLFPTSLFDQYIINGLFFKKNAIKEIEFNINNENDTNLLDSLYLNDIGEYKLEALKTSYFKIIDTTSGRLLEELGYSSNIFDIYGKVMPEKLLDRSKPANLELNNFRLRMAEVISHLMYNQIQQSVALFKKKAETNTNAKIDIDKNFIISNLQTVGLLQYTKSMNPLEELLFSTKVSKTGLGNTTKQQLTLERRDLNPSYFGTISPTTTNEYGGIGSNQTLTIGSKIKDAFGNIEVKDFDNKSNPFENLSISEALNPFIEYNDTTRAIMGNQQTGQFVEIQKPDEPLVQTGFEAVVPHLVSSRFAKKAKDNGKIVKITNSSISVKYNDGSSESINIKMLKTRTKRGIYIPSEYKVLVSEGQKINKGQILASTSSIASGKISMGKNLVVAELPYYGFNYEDGWVVSENIKEKFLNNILTKITIRIPQNCIINKDEFNLLNFVSSKEYITKPGDILLEYQKDNFKIDMDETNDDLDDESDDIITGLIQKDKTIKYLSPGGIIKDIVIKINNIDTIPKEIINLHKILTEPLQDILNNCQKKYKETTDQIKCLGHIENLEMLSIGEHKLNNVPFEGAIIEVYILTDNPVRNGSKFILSNSGGKGTIQYVIPKDKTPIAMGTGLQIDFIGTPLSIIGRKSPNIILNLYLGKIIYFLNTNCIELAKKGKFSQIKKLVFDLFDIIDQTDKKILLKQLSEFFNKEQRTILKMILNSDPLNRPIFPAIVPPFSNHLNIKDLEKAAKLLNIPLNEKVYIKEHDVITESEVVVGILPVYMLEHFPKGMSSVRGSINVKNQFISGQGVSGSQEGKGSIKVGLYDMYGLLSKNSGEGKNIPNLLKELHSIKSDATSDKRKYINSLIIKNELPSINIEEEISHKNTPSKNWIEALFLGCGLQPEF